jgi:nicotinamidase-related amidase
MAERLDAAHTALLYFDMLKGGIDRFPERRAAMEAAGVIESCRQVLQAGRTAGLAVLYARANHRPDGADAFAGRLTDVDMEGRSRQAADATVGLGYLVHAGSADAEVIDELRPAPADYDIPKKRWSAFFQTHLDLSLRTRGVDTIVLMGISTEVGIASTAFSARDLDYNLVIVRDACWSRREGAHELLMDRVFPLMARVRTAEQVVGMLNRLA